MNITQRCYPINNEMNKMAITNNILLPEFVIGNY